MIPKDRLASQKWLDKKVRERNRKLPLLRDGWDSSSNVRKHLERTGAYVPY